MLFGEKLKTIVVLGMHRSATSLIAMGLYRSGVFMGQKMLGPGRGNELGHFEDVELLFLNEKILKLSGGSWDNPPDEHKIYEVGLDLEDEIKTAVEQRSMRKLWGWKDPRTVLTIRCFQRFLTNPIYVSLFRDPHEVAVSLNKRDGMPIDQGKKLAKEYNKRLLKFLSEQT